MAGSEEGDSGATRAGRALGRALAGDGSRKAGKAVGKALRGDGPTKAGRAVGQQVQKVKPQIDQVKETAQRASSPVRGGWSILMAYVWVVGFAWIGGAFAVALPRATGQTSAWVTTVCIGGGVTIGIWLAQHRVRRHHDRTLPPSPKGVGLAIAAWLGLIGVAVLVVDLT